MNATKISKLLPNSKACPTWAKWLAQDADGTWWVYEVEPLQYHKGWYENEVGRRMRLAQGVPNDNWPGSLYQIFDQELLLKVGF